MKRFLETNFFLLLEASASKGVEVPELRLRGEYEKFSFFLFGETKKALGHDGFSFHQILCYTRVELSAMRDNACIEKKMKRFPGISKERCYLLIPRLIFSDT
jgi:hypothetical protein